MRFSRIPKWTNLDFIEVSRLGIDLDRLGQFSRKTVLQQFSILAGGKGADLQIQAAVVHRLGCDSSRMIHQCWRWDVPGGGLTNRKWWRLDPVIAE